MSASYLRAKLIAFRAAQKYDIDDFTGNNYRSLFDDETARMFKSVPLEHAAVSMFTEALPGWA